MFRSLLAIATLALRSALRSRLAVALFAAVAVVMVVLPGQLQGDGTAAGTLRMVVSYSLGTAVVLLCISSLWLGCAAFPAEIEAKRFDTERITPAPHIALVLGRWLGLVALHVALLVFALGATWVQAHRLLPNAEARIVREHLDLTKSDIAEEADRLTAASINDDVEEVLRVKAHDGILADLTSDEALPVDPGMSHQWRFVVDEAARTRPLRIELSYTSAYGALQGVAGHFEARGADSILAELTLTNDDAGKAVLELPANALAKTDTLIVTFENHEKTDTGASVLVRHGAGLRATYPSGSLAANLVRGGIVIAALLALLAALGLFLGCAFSFPVAAFLATAICIMLSIGGRNRDVELTEHSMRTPTQAELRIEAVSRTITQGLEFVTAPCRNAAPLDRLGAGMRERPAEAARALAVDGLLAPFALCILAALALRRAGNREE